MGLFLLLLGSQRTSILRLCYYPFILLHARLCFLDGFCTNPLRLVCVCTYKHVPPRYMLHIQIQI